MSVTLNDEQVEALLNAGANRRAELTRVLESAGWSQPEAPEPVAAAVEGADVEEDTDAEG